MTLKRIKYTLILTLGAILMTTNANAQLLVNVDSVYNNKIKTIETRLFPFGEPSLLLINNSNERLSISFDDMNAQAENYGYSLKLCNADWSDSQLSKFDYIDGFIENDIESYTYSLKTVTEYVHYEIRLPNNSVKFKIAGNYLLTVFNLDNKELLFTKRIVVCNNDVNISTHVTKVKPKNSSKALQVINVSAEYAEEIINTLTETYSATIVKNNNWNDAIYGVPLNIVGDNRLFASDDIHFTSNNEFRQFDIESLNTRGENVQSTLFSLNKHYARLEIDTPSNYTDYVFKEDKNGWFTIKNNQKKGADVTSEYIEVAFTLLANKELSYGKVYVTGLFNQWKTVDKMTYDERIQAYTATLNLKQGTYNYSYGLKTNEGFNPYFFEGNMIETDNEYFVVIYKNDIANNYDEVIGMATINPQ